MVLYKLEISFIWTGIASKALVCGQGMLSGMFYGWKATRKIKNLSIKDNYQSADIIKDPHRVRWVLVHADKKMLESEVEEFKEKKRTELRDQTMEQWLEKMGIMVDYEFSEVV